jgi:hypothetical protein
MRETHMYITLACMRVDGLREMSKAGSGNTE